MGGQAGEKRAGNHRTEQPDEVSLIHDLATQRSAVAAENSGSMVFEYAGIVHLLIILLANGK